jgi:hypothetical protein
MGKKKKWKGPGPHRTPSKISVKARKIIRAYLAKEIEKYGYRMTGMLAEYKVNIYYDNTSPFPSGHNNSIDRVTIKFIDDNIYGKIQQGKKIKWDKIANAADPKCAEKVAAFVLVNHLQVLRERWAVHSKWMAKLESEINLIHASQEACIDEMAGTQYLLL